MPRRIIDGLTYNTLTSTAIARSEWDNGSGNDTEIHTATLYQTQGGAFFVIEEWMETRQRADGEWVDRDRTEWTPMSPERAHNWMLTGDVEVISDPFGLDVPEATAEPEEGITSSVRIPAALNRAVEAKAKAAGISKNAQILRCLEQCTRGPKVVEAAE